VRDVRDTVPRLFLEEDERPEMDPQSAAVWSMIFPGLGHWKLGRRAEAIARFGRSAR
jgi:hypothetical protein